MSLPPVINYVEFEVLTEPWIKYNLSDGGKLLMRTVVTSIIKTGQYDPFGKPVYAVMSNTLQVVRAPKDLRGNPTMPPATLEQLGSSVVAEVNASPESDEWNAYKCEDGTTLQLRTTIITVTRTSKYDPTGEPIYIVNSQNMIKDEVPKLLWKKSTSGSNTPNFGT
ncbi:MAG: hypothetical protein KGI02_07740 [Thaumarchaeota archaeon]|nr:hypothetical protein [Nitrososphaerota archaeon]MDE1841089.1 hypothetical protein [Nitrososphaerota archaeon]